MQGHDLVSGPNELAAYEDSGHGRAAADHLCEFPFHLLPLGVVIELVHGRIHAEFANEQLLNSVAHATGAVTEDHHCPLGGQFHHSIHRRR
ncbi:hypothetical protein AXF42_Ash016698 [Apostasia shenzhenica]|uniref:Uncharacterized protein n=1 Tax=Apostasia shenzhenica TaxID=1088818 RepID=A0A2I0AQ24_9ASPA|nr:hypothetical protein AXF42_Ash016698 [Apostasia shenzhenica]